MAFVGRLREVPPPSTRYFGDPKPVMYRVNFLVGRAPTGPAGVVHGRHGRGRNTKIPQRGQHLFGRAMAQGQHAGAPQIQSNPKHDRHNHYSPNRRTHDQSTTSNARTSNANDAHRCQSARAQRYRRQYGTEHRSVVSDHGREAPKHSWSRYTPPFKQPFNTSQSRPRPMASVKCVLWTDRSRCQWQSQPARPPPLGRSPTRINRLRRWPSPPARLTRPTHIRFCPEGKTTPPLPPGSATQKKRLSPCRRPAPRLHKHGSTLRARP